jgi:hypothetical protein
MRRQTPNLGFSLSLFFATFLVTHLLFVPKSVFLRKEPPFLSFGRLSELKIRADFKVAPM